jgi:hypothetical protein
MTNIEDISEQDLLFLKYLARRRLGWIARCEILDAYSDGAGVDIRMLYSWLVDNYYYTLLCLFQIIKEIIKLICRKNT